MVIEIQHIKTRFIRQLHQLYKLELIKFYTKRICLMKLKFEISEDFIKKCSIYKDLKYWILLVNWGMATRWGGPLGGEPCYKILLLC